MARIIDDENTENQDIHANTSPGSKGKFQKARNCDRNHKVQFENYSVEKEKAK